MLSVFKYLFREYVTAEDMDTEQMRKATMQEFSHWVEPRLAVLLADEELIQADIPEQVKGFITELWQDTFSLCAVLVPIWPLLTCSGYPPLKHELTALRCVLILEYADGVNFPVCVPSPTLPPGLSKLDTATVSAMIQQYLYLIQSFVQGRGLDAIYDEVVTKIRETDSREAFSPKSETPDIAPDGSAG